MNMIAEPVPVSVTRKNDRPLRVLLVTQASGGGVGRHFLDLAEELVAEGVDVTGIYAPRKVDALFRQRLSAGGLPPMHVLPMRRAVHPLDTLDYMRLLKTIRRLGPFDLIHGHSSKGGALARLAANRLKIPSVYTSHAIVTLDPTLPPWQRRFYAKIERWLARRTAAMIAVSEDEAGHIVGLGIDSHKVHVVPNGIPQPKFPSREDSRRRLGIAPEDVVVGFVGRLTSQKAPDILLDSFAKALKTNPSLRLVMVGSGPLDVETREHVDRLRISNRVSLLGDVVAIDIMPSFDVFCLSSRYEAMPYVYLEALAAGLPIISTRVGGATMCVEPGRNGMIVPPEDRPALAAAITALAQDADVRRRQAAASLEMAAEFTSRQMVARTLEVYASALTTARRHSREARDV